MAFFNDDFIYQLKDNNRIEDVMSSYAVLKKSGRSNFVCLCPFHSEKTPSCNINVANQYFHCFGCDTGGDVITFIMKAENLDYVEAVRFLAQRAGMTVPEDGGDSEKAKLRMRIYEANREAARFYNRILTKERAGEKGRYYLNDRQLEPRTVIKYGLGYAPDEWTMLTDHLLSKGFSEFEITSADLARRGRNDSLYDFFRDRLIFPIIDLRGNVIAFGGRTIDGNGPKYLNSADTPVFKKSRHLFSLNFAKNSSDRRIILAEGYMDVISLNQAGFDNAVASLGTALTPEQVREINKYASEVILSYDSDEAGQKATMRALNLFGETGITTKILRIDGAKDPDEYIKKYGAQRFRMLLDRSDGAVNFELERLAQGLDMTSDEGKVEYLKRCAKLLSGLTSPIERDYYISRLAERQEVSAEAIKAQIEGIRKRAERREKNEEWNRAREMSLRAKDPAQRKDPGKFRAEQQLIVSLYKDPGELKTVAGRISPEDISSEKYRQIYEGMKRLYDEGGDLNNLQAVLSVELMSELTSALYKNEQIELTPKVREELIERIKSKRTGTGEIPDLAAIAARKKKGR
ncbi:MAG: DNA primase [Oscillospiraceae bacterium]|nr:DNA primase [Oscillospiraceae bacterium]